MSMRSVQDIMTPILIVIHKNLIFRIPNRFPAGKSSGMIDRPMWTFDVERKILIVLRDLLQKLVDIDCTSRTDENLGIRDRPAVSSNNCKPISCWANSLNSSERFLRQWLRMSLPIGLQPTPRTDSWRSARLSRISTWHRTSLPRCWASPWPDVLRPETAWCRRPWRSVWEWWTWRRQRRRRTLRVGGWLGPSCRSSQSTSLSRRRWSQRRPLGSAITSNRQATDLSVCIWPLDGRSIALVLLLAGARSDGVLATTRLSAQMAQMIARRTRSVKMVKCVKGRTMTAHLTADTPAKCQIEHTPNV